MRTVLGRTLRPVAALALTGMTAACGAPDHVTVSDAWVRLSAVKTNPAAAYFMLHGGPKDATLINVSTDTAVRAEMHETMNMGASMTKMQPVANVPLPARETVVFKPGGRHVMLFDINPGIKPGMTMRLTLSFADGSRLTEPAKVIGAGDPAPE